MSNQVIYDIIVNSKGAQKSLENFYKSVNKNIGKSINQTEKLDKSIDKLSNSLKNLSGEKGVKKFNKGLKSAIGNLDKVEKKIKNINRLSLKTSGGSGGRGGRYSSRGMGRNPFMTGGMGMLGGLGAYGIIGMLTGMGQSGIKFESAMTDIDGILGKADKGFGNLEETIRRVGKESAYTINEMAGAAKFMAMAGMGSESIKGSLGTVSNLGMVGNLGVERSADIITNIMTSMGIDPTKHSSNVADIITATMTNANVSIEEIGQSMAYTGNIAAMTGRDISEVSAAIGVLGDNGIKASRAGTNLRQMFLKLAAPSKKGQETIDRLGINLYEIGSHGKKQLRPISELLKEFRKSGAGLTEFKDILGVRGGQAFSALVTGASKYNDLLKEIEGSGNITENLAAKKRRTTAGRIFIMKSAFDDLSIAITDRVRPALNKVLEGFTKLFNKLSTNHKFLGFIEDSANAIAKAMYIAYEALKFLFNFLIENKSAVFGAITLISGAMAGLAVKSLAMSLMNPFTGWIAAGAGFLFILNKVMESMPSNPNQSDASLSGSALANRYRDRLAAKSNDLYKKINSGGLPIDEAMRLKAERDEIGKYSGWFTKDEDIINFYQGKYMTSHQRKLFMLEQRDAAKKGTYGNKAQQVQAEITNYLKEFVAPKGSEADKILTKINQIRNSDMINMGGVSDKGTTEGDAVGTLSTASPLTSSANEMSRSVIVNFNADSALAKIEVHGGGLGDQSVQAQIESEMAQVFRKVVADFELGMSY